MKKIKDLFNKVTGRQPKNKPVYIETPRLIIREIKKEDTDKIFQMTTAPGFYYCYFDGTKESVTKFVDRALETQNPAKGQKRTEYLLTVVEKSTGDVIGHVSLESEKLVETYTHSVNFFMDPQIQNKGYGKEAAINIMRYAIEDLGMPGFSVTIHPDNKPSLAVGYSQGYKEVGRTTLQTTRGVEPRIVLVLQKETFYEQRKHDKVPYLLPKKPANSNRNWFCKKKAP